MDGFKSFFNDFWHLIGSNQLAVIVTVIGVIVGLIGIYIALPSREAYRKKQQIKAHQKQHRNISPFITGKAVTRPQFVGRKPELNFLYNALQNGESISLLGKRRIGKSSLLATWKKSLLEDGYKVILLNGQKSEGESLQRLIHVITQGLPSETLSADSAADHLVQWAKNQTAEKHKKPIILVDECEAIIKQCPHRFWERVRGALGNIIWVFSSTQPLDSLYKHYHNEGSPFENQLKTQWLSLLDKSACEKIIEKGQFNQQQQALLKQWTGCHPFYLQSFANRLWLAKPNTEVEVTTVLDSFKMDAERHLNDLWQSLSKAQQIKLQAYIHNRQTINDSALRAMGIITPQGQPFSRVFLEYLQDKQYV